AAAAYIRETAAEQGAQEGVRLRILAGGCSGLEYRLHPPAPREGPPPGGRGGTSHGHRLPVDPQSAPPVPRGGNGPERTLLRRGFKIRNPNATSTCSCGDSFGV